MTEGQKTPEEIGKMTLTQAACIAQEDPPEGGVERLESQHDFLTAMEERQRREAEQAAEWERVD